VARRKHADVVSLGAVKLAKNLLTVIVEFLPPDQPVSFCHSIAICRDPLPIQMRGWDVLGRTIWITDAHRDDGRRFIVHADEILTAFLELERAIYEFAVSSIS
jgi:hypothetical protein